MTTETVPELLPECLPVLGIPLSVIDSYESALALIRERIIDGRQTFCAAINPAKIYLANRNPKFKCVLDSAHMHICDGIGAALAARLIHHRRVPRCTGIELFLRLVSLSAREGWKIFLLGASPESNAAARRKLIEAHPGLRVVGNRDGYFKDSAEIVGAINNSGADLLFVAMGSPRQELWIGEHLPNLETRFCMGIGGSLDVVSGSVKWAPEICRKTGTEWLHRALAQPSRFPRLWTNGLFALDVLGATLAGHRKHLPTSR
jgi:N-acetylglucosaminyldiphosphoundecaprenol N-acetyl-beta-D-mannosaminyltransferase